MKLGAVRLAYCLSV